MTIAPKKPIKTLDDLVEEAYRRASLENADLERGSDCRWGGMALTCGKHSPINDRMLVVALFHDADEIRAYEVPVKQADGGQPANPRRISLPKAAAPVPLMAPNGEIKTHGGSLFVEEMTLERMADLLAEEFSVLDGAVTTAERERTAILEFGAKLPPEYSLREFLEDIREGEHLEVDDEEPQPDGQAVPAPTVAS